MQIEIQIVLSIANLVHNYISHFTKSNISCDHIYEVAKLEFEDPRKMLVSVR